MKRFVPLLFLFFAGVLASCKPATEPSPAAKKSEDNKAEARKVDFVEIAKVYKEMKGPPKDKEDFRKVLKTDKLKEYFDKDQIVFYYGVSTFQMPDGSSATIVGHEAKSDESKKRWVIMGDGTVQIMTDADFEEAPKAGKF